MIRVLVVDDDEVLREVLHDGLHEGGFDVHSRNSGASARLLLKEQHFDILLSDLYMPEGGGEELINWCQQEFPDLKILAMSGKYLNKKISHLDVLRARGIPTLSKPFTIEGLRAIIKSIMEGFYEQ